MHTHRSSYRNADPEDHPFRGSIPSPIHLFALVTVTLTLTFTLNSLPLFAVDHSPVEYFETHIRPVLVEQCYGCHSTKSEKGLRAGLSVETREGLLKGGETGPAVVPGHPDQSLLIKAIRYSDEKLQMPPKNKKLPPEVVAHFEEWVKQGAVDPRSITNQPSVIASSGANHWAFQPIHLPSPPVLADSKNVKTPIDSFIVSALAQKGLTPGPQADKRTLIRRATFDLHGLPPTASEVRDFESDSSPEAYAKLIDRLLASPRYGERWGRYWLDIARYADTKGYVFEEERRYPYSYTYRDYVIRAFNEDLPFDQFVQQQLAADQLNLGEDQRPLAALGFLTLGRRFLNNQHDIIDDRIDVVTRGLMGLTVGCARCHDHKFDPVPIQDYYSLYGIFQSSHEPGEKPLLGKSSLPKEYPEYLKERDKRLEERRVYRAENDAKAFLRVRSMVGDYLRVMHDEDATPAGEEREKLVRGRKLEPVVARKFRPSYSTWKTNPPPLLKPWFAFASKASPSNTFQIPALEILKALPADAPKDLLSILSGSETNAPQSLTDIANRYNDWFAESAKALNVTNAESVAAPLRERAGFLTAATSPLNLNADELHPLFETPVQQKLRALQRKIDELDATHAGAPPRAMALMDNSNPSNARVLKRGNPGNPGEEVPRQFLKVLAGPERKPFQKGSGRLELAQAITSTNNPLTSRVFVNRVWTYHLGSPLVRTPSDFGVRSDPPTHPQLLDYLAGRFMAEGWSVKKLHRMIMLSSVYQQVSDDREDGQHLDPANHLYWRQNRKRLDFESMRDTLLYLSGTLDPGMGGQPVEIATEPSVPRRTVYGFVERQNLPGVFRTFDFASPDVSSSQRFTTTVPQQALFLMNSPFIIQQAQNIMKRPEVMNAASTAAKVDRLYELVYQRPPSAEERQLAMGFMKQLESEPAAEPEKPAWRYGYGTLDPNEGRVTDFKSLPHYNNYAWQGGAKLPDDKLGWVLLNAQGGHPGKQPGFAAIRRWTAPRAGTLELKGKLEHPAKEGDGVRGTIVLNQSRKLGQWTAHNGSTRTGVSSVEVKAGDTLDWVVDSRSNEGYDSFLWTPKIQYMSENRKSGSGSVSESGSGNERQQWNAQEDFAGPVPPAPKRLKPEERYAQALLVSNEVFFID